MNPKQKNVFPLKHICYGLILSFLFSSCGKNNTGTPNNELNATVALSSGNTITFNGKATAYKDVWGYAHISGINSANAEVNISFQTLSSPGTYNLWCEYRVDASTIYSDHNYVNTQATNKGSVTITAVSSNHVEGTFTATCKTSMNATDSAIVTGSFKGYY